VAQSWSSLLTNRTGTELQLIQATRSDSTQNWEVIQPNQLRLPEGSQERSTENVKEMLRKTNGQIEYIGQAIAGPNREENLWYLGAYPAIKPQYAVVIIIENGTVESTRELGRSLLRLPYEE